MYVKKSISILRFSNHSSVVTQMATNGTLGEGGQVFKAAAAPYERIITKINQLEFKASTKHTYLL